MSVDLLARTAAAAGLRLALLDGDGVEVRPMAGDAVRGRDARRAAAGDPPGDHQLPRPGVGPGVGP
ncbi:hypothetical protein OF117_16995 [Geodermatophilus sp. YIM 151500]|uniref:hypothetical protein n=1 Tax=Geodermatophilus sp. YIM 151500 TaxID=2984531 RepID=UPI0021E35AD7|nr:hypothetical protein [Geodermatophilus sp. YIM 151500]MCV2491053.1 hypothetical protein [Geodermatophilus sp. YIM 151500]